jgi:hypothetical protein
LSAPDRLPSPFAKDEQQLLATFITEICHPTAYQVLLPNTNNNFSLLSSPIFASDSLPSPFTKYEQKLLATIVTNNCTRPLLPLIAGYEQQLHRLPSPFAEHEQQLLAPVVTDTCIRQLTQSFCQTRTTAFRYHFHRYLNPIAFTNH